jgi:hypothetical protein
MSKFVYPHDENMVYSIARFLPDRNEWERWEAMKATQQIREGDVVIRFDGPEDYLPRPWLVTSRDPTHKQWVLFDLMVLAKDLYNGKKNSEFKHYCIFRKNQIIPIGAAEAKPNRLKPNIHHSRPLPIP